MYFLRHTTKHFIIFYVKQHYYTLLILYPSTEMSYDKGNFMFLITFVYLQKQDFHKNIFYLQKSYYKFLMSFFARIILFHQLINDIHIINLCSCLQIKTFGI